ncbi:MAG: alcohol dehydrogenase GroES domain-containing protein [Parcubacteria group bacterium Gr01-1014_38]|nr:MAG: alcohol dehydrogenase GroES domain-containing protein [Parcubacteria group bacterium Gr01-1014_38]
MKAIGLTVETPGIRVVDLPSPAIERETQVKIRVAEVGIDGTDKNLVQHHLVDVEEGESHLVLGHEAWGVVSDVGKSVKNFRVGDPVIPTVRRGCGICAACLNFQSDYCYTGLYKERGIHKLHGFLSEEVVDEEAYLVPLPKDQALIAVWIEPLSIVEKALDQLRLVQQRMPSWCPHPTHAWDAPDWGGCKRAIVIGAGPLGFLATVMLRLQDVETYVVEIVDPDTTRVRMIERVGAKHLDGRAFSPEELVRGVGRIDLVFEASGASKLAIEFIPYLPRNAVYVMTGVPRAGGVTVPVNADLMLRQMVRHNLAVIGSVNSNASHFARALEDVRVIRKRFGTVLEDGITHRFLFGSAEQAFAVLQDPNSLKVVLDVLERPAVNLHAHS